MKEIIMGVDQYPRKTDWRVALQGILSRDGDIVAHGEQVEKKAD
ncbi:conserved hypothetical protein [Afipia carboxidovorans OM5]|jgi:hypothetical protein|nr:hypothetical protein [Afipia carboxidovorans]ACI94831.1 conserved hypothetical protein [Afipia carboxidovorans OM5]